MSIEKSQSSSASAMSPAPFLETTLMQMINGGLLQQALYVATKLGIADLLAERPQTAAELANRTQTQAGALYRVLRALAAKSIFAEMDDQTFTLTSNAILLCTGVPGSVRDLVIFLGEEWHWRVWAHMLDSVQTGNPAWKQVHGLEMFPWLSAHSEQYDIFNRAMTSFSYSAVPAVVEAYDFSGINTLADIAGGHGWLLTGILKTHPQLTGILFDLPQVIAGAGDLIEREGVAGRIELATGNFFESIPPGADAYLMKSIIHDWDDQYALKILRNVYRAMPSHGKLLLIEMVVPVGNHPHISKVLDLEMLVSPGGIERTRLQYESLLAQAAFQLTSIIPTRTSLSIIEGVKGAAG